MKFKDITGKSKKDLQQMVITLTEELFQLRLKNTTGQLEKKSQIRIVRRDIARVKTRLTALSTETNVSK